MDDEIEKELLFEIDMLSQFGFYDKNDIYEIIEDMFYDEKLDYDFIEREVEHFLSLKKSEEETWNEVNDCDKLESALLELNEYGIITLQNAGYTEKDSIGDAIEVYRYLKDKKYLVYGFCFYNTMDIENAISDNYLEIGFGEFIGEELKRIKIAEDIIFILEKHGLNVKWGYSADERIVLKPFNWQKRYDGEGYGMERAYNDFINNQNMI